MSIMIGIDFRSRIIYDWKYYFMMGPLFECLYAGHVGRWQSPSFDFLFVFEELHIKIVVYCGKQLTGPTWRGCPGLGLPAWQPVLAAHWVARQARALGANLEPPQRLAPPANWKRKEATTSSSSGGEEWSAPRLPCPAPLSRRMPLQRPRLVS